jgi:hypothetical protein
VVLTFQVDPDPCKVLDCNIVSQPVEVCRDHRCPHRWTREAREDRARREVKDGKARAEG